MIEKHSLSSPSDKGHQNHTSSSFPSFFLSFSSILAALCYFTSATFLNGFPGFYFGDLDTVGGFGFGDTTYFPLALYAIMISNFFVLFGYFA